MPVHSSILFHKEDIRFRLNQAEKLKAALVKISRKEGFKIKGINYVFCSDAYLKKINKEYLNHNYFTDIITFDNSEEKGILEADIFISIERVKENALLFKTSFPSELKRVMIHGLLHLCGYGDKTIPQQKEMRKKEDSYLSL
ncbi:MAG: rRNA maturation RNase YbeY [Cytophagaceae bacterium]|nr:rRNA maturation RNase YbeY [Cytophagaceae bacterium]